MKKSKPENKPCLICGREYKPGGLYAGNEAICPECWAKVSAGVPVTMPDGRRVAGGREGLENLEKMGRAELEKRGEPGDKIQAWADLLKEAKYQFKIDKQGLPPEMVRWAEDYEQKTREELTAEGLDKPTAEMTREDLARLSGVLLLAINRYSKEFTERFQKLKRPEKPRPPAKTVIAGSFFDQLFSTEKSALSRLNDPETRTELIKSKIEGVIANQKIGLGLDVYELRIIQGIFNLATGNPHPERLVIRSWDELYRACGAKETDGELDKGDKIELYKTFLRLRDKNYDMIGRAITGYDEKTKEKIYETAVIRGPLYQAVFYYRDVREGKLREVTDQINQEGHNFHAIGIYLNKLFLQEYSDYWRLVDSSLYHDIKGVLGPRERVSKYDMYFILWLHRHALGRAKVETNIEALAEELGMVENLRPKKRLARIERTLRRSYKIAYDLGYLSRPAGHKIRAKRKPTKEVFHLNPEKIVAARQGNLPGLEPGEDQADKPAN